MHEFHLMKSLIKKLDSIQEEAGDNTIAGIHFFLGALCHMDEAHFRQHFDDAAQGKPYQHVELKFDLSADISHPNAQHVVIESVDIEQ